MRTLPPFALTLRRSALRAGNSHHVAERGEDDPGLRGNRDRFVDHFQWGYTDGAAGAVNKRDLFRQKRFKPGFNDGVSLAAADFH